MSNIKDLFLDYEKKIEDTKLERKHFEKYKLDIIKYNKDTSDLENSLTRKCRSVIIDPVNQKNKSSITI